MDIAIKKKKKLDYKRYVAIAAGVILAAVVIKYLMFLGEADFSVERETLVLSEVQRDDFTVSVRGSGVLVPEDIQWLAANVESKVERLVVKAGNQVKAGDLIVSLSNPQLVQQLEENKWELEAMEAEFKAAEVAEESTLLNMSAQVINMKMNYESSLAREKAQQQLLSTNAVSKLDYERTTLETKQYKERWQISQQQYKKMKDNLKAQNVSRLARLNKTRKIVERIQQQVDELQVKATMDSLVLEMPLEPGQRIAMGTNIAKLARHDSLIAELQIPEIQIRDVAVGQKVIIDTRNSKFEGEVSRVDPAVGQCE